MLLVADKRDKRSGSAFVSPRLFARMSVRTSSCTLRGRAPIVNRLLANRQSVNTSPRSGRLANPRGAGEENAAEAVDGFRTRVRFSAESKFEREI